MSNVLKYNLEILDWQQFELLAFKCLQFDVSRSIHFIEGGGDKGRDFVYKGVTKFFNEESEKENYIFQAKHKKSSKGYSSLKSDLLGELRKVYIENCLKYTCYCLVTNITLSGDQYDELHAKFESFINKSDLGFNVSFQIYSYRHIESCIDVNESLKWGFPIIIKNTDFSFLINKIINKKENNTIQGWLSVFERNRERFIYTNIYDEAILRLESKNMLLLSGPPKSGKTFNAEMIVFSYSCEKSFIPYKIDRVEEFVQYYDTSKKQIFLFDDAFGKHNIDLYRSDSFDRNFDYIFEHIDDTHKCIFTSREYIVKAFVNYSDADLNKVVEKINVEILNLSDGEKESLFRRYFRVFIQEGTIPNNLFIEDIISHKNYSPETVRAYFENNDLFDLKGFNDHLRLPDKYLEKVFMNLGKEKRIVLLSILFSLKNDEASIACSFKNISKDLNCDFLLTLKNELNLLEGSIIKRDNDLYDFYHPSMFDFFVKYLGRDIAIYRAVLFKNLNQELISLLNFGGDKSSIIISVGIDDIDNLIVGVERIIKNPYASVIHINSLFSWFRNTDFQINFKVKLKEQHKGFKDSFVSSLKEYDCSKLISEDLYHVCSFLENIFSLKDEVIINENVLINLLDRNKQEEGYWLLVFRIIPFLKGNFLLDHNGKDWLNNFYRELKSEIDILGKELYGDEYPEFIEVIKYQKELELLREQKRYEKTGSLKPKQRSEYKQKTSNSWYPRFKKCQEKIRTIKSSQPYGYKIYAKLDKRFGHLRNLEDNQRQRYNFNKKNKWWVDMDSEISE